MLGRLKGLFNSDLKKAQRQAEIADIARAEADIARAKAAEDGLKRATTPAAANQE